MEDGSPQRSEYRLRDAANGKDMQTAVGLRNGWRVAEGLRMTTNVEKLSATTGDATAIGVGLNTPRAKSAKGSGRVEWREDTNNTNWLTTLGVARKLTATGPCSRDYASLVGRCARRAPMTNSRTGCRWAWPTAPWTTTSSTRWACTSGAPCAT